MTVERLFRQQSVCCALTLSLSMSVDKNCGEAVKSAICMLFFDSSTSHVSREMTVEGVFN